MGVVIVGPSGSGKSTVWRLLKAALNRRQTVKDYTMNPKAIPRTQVNRSGTRLSIDVYVSHTQVVWARLLA